MKNGGTFEFEDLEETDKMIYCRIIHRLSFNKETQEFQCTCAGNLYKPPCRHIINWKRKLGMDVMK